MRPIPPPPSQLKAARLLLMWTRAEVGQKLQSSRRMVGQAEVGQSGRLLPTRMAALYEAAGIEFLSDGQVRMKLGSK
jgi:hypothetical protein